MISRESIRLLICAFGAALLVTFRLPAGAQALVPELRVDSAVATAGYYRLSWRPADITVSGLEYQLQESTSPDFLRASTIYQGPDLASVLSGRSDALRYYRIRSLRNGQAASPWSTPLQVETRHHPLARAIGFFVFGAFVFVSTLLLVVRGSRAIPEGRSPTRG